MSTDESESVLMLSRRVAKVLRTGAGLSAVLLVVGILVLLFNPTAEVGSTLPLSELPSALARGEPSALTTLGILVMIVTPIARVFILVEGFFARKDMEFALIGLVVLLILLLSIGLAF